tara:strand:+ start:3647 stop:4369 length:723 start_codon:yes stop_codon:yes gene_type:complete
MSEQESLINTEQETKNEVGEVAERPEWLPEKFWNDGNPDYENLSKSYAELEKLSSRKKEELTTEIKTEIEQEQLKSIPEAPDKYILPEIPEQYNTETPLMEGWKKYCHDNKLNQDAFNAGIDLFIKSQPQFDEKAELAKLGENATQRLEAVSLWTNKNFNEGERLAISNICTTAEGVQAVEKMIAMAQTTVSLEGEASLTSGKTRADLEVMMKDVKYWHPTHRDDNYVKQINEAFEKLYR